MDDVRRPLSCALLAFVVVCGAAPDRAGAQAGGNSCLTTDPPPIDAPARDLRFGISPGLAGTVGGGQGESEPEDPDARDEALADLRPRRRTMVVRLNRLFESDGREGIERFAKLARHYSRAGFAVESQVRYHPAPEQEGDMKTWARFVRRAARALGGNRALVALTITNEVNLPLSANTSDGAYDGAIEAILRGVPAARRALDGIGRRDVRLGFSYAYRYLPGADAQFWTSIGERSSRRFRSALDYVGVQLYPGLFWPPALVTQTAGEATIEALTLVRDCWMPMAGLGDGIDLWVTENGYTSGLGHTEARQASELRDTLREIHDYSGTLGVTDFRYFNLRDNRENGTDLFDNVGLLRPDYSRKPAVEVFRRAVRDLGTG